MSITTENHYKQENNKYQNVTQKEKSNEWITADIPMDEENDYRDVEWSDLAIPKEDLDLD